MLSSKTCPPALLLAGLLLLFTVTGAGASVLVPQTALPGPCIPQFSVQLPVFGPAGDLPRVNTRKHPFISIEMKESRQQVLPLPGQASYPASFFDPINQAEVLCPAVNVQPTQIWAYETSDTLTGKLLGPAHWPAVTVEAP